MSVPAASNFLGPSRAAHQLMGITLLFGGFTPHPVASAIAGGVVGSVYSETIAAVGGTSPYTFSVTSGSLPAGLTLNASTGVISGTPTAAATSTFTITATDVNGHSGSQSFTIVVAAASGGGTSNGGFGWVS